MYIIRRIFRWISFAIIFFLVSSVSAVVVLKWLPVYYTPLMFIRVAEQVADGRKPKIEHEWVSIDRISENMPLAGVSSEDARFLKHKSTRPDFKPSVEERSGAPAPYPNKPPKTCFCGQVTVG